MTTITIAGGSFSVTPAATLNFVNEVGFYLADGLATGAPDPSLFVEGMVNVSFTSAAGIPRLSGLLVGTGVPFSNPVLISPTGAFIVTSTVPGRQVFGYYADGSSPPFTNEGVFKVTGQGDAVGLATWDSKPFSFNNKGTFQVTSSAGGASGVLLENGGAFHNSAAITVWGQGDVTGVMAAGPTGSFDNSGAIIADNSAGTAVAVDWRFGSAHQGWNNSGEIDGEYALKASVDGSVSAPITYTNSGKIVGWVSLTDGADNFTNTGKIVGEVNLGDGNNVFTNYGNMSDSVDLTMGSGDDTVTNGGAIALFGASWDLVVNLGGGNDVFNVLAGSSVLGRIDGGAGSDAMTFDTARSAFSVHTAMIDGVFVTTLADSTDADGTTLVQNVETFAFNGAAFGFAGVQQNHQQNLDGGLYDDVLFQRASTGTVYYQDMNGSGSPGGFQNVLGSLPVGWKAVGSADLGNGTAYAIIRDSNTGSLYSVTPESEFWQVITNSITPNWQYVGAGDVDRDGRVEVVISDPATGTILYGGAPHAAWKSVANVGPAWKAVGVGDFNRDGSSDVAIQNQADGTVYYANMAGGSFSGWGVVTGAVGTAWKVVGTGDINGDGYADVVFQNSSTGQVWWVNMLGGTNHAWGEVASVSGWTVRDIADLNNDGYADVVIQNNTDGTTYYADMQGGTFHGWGVVSGAVGTDWVVV